MGINELEKFLKSGKIEILGTDIVRSGYDYISKYCNDNEEPVWHMSIKESDFIPESEGLQYCIKSLQNRVDKYNKLLKSVKDLK